jgi:hypothetical protein
MISKEKRSEIEILKEQASDGTILLVLLIIVTGNAVGSVYISAYASQAQEKFKLVGAQIYVLFLRTYIRNKDGATLTFNSACVWR